ncbi:MAG: hypothetical protein A2504_06385 [Bdellovibrionales bacterium RIFOXYD12_FULL_39_22]|nr:MAG: hypothetical protein A2385_08705 [Bdellovibrionales bacterium RIFOXYB1_FULL_39_21]OFZ45215.1 MAG: hypothetical protein A2485_05825 [Bdellovibrionales bacterium RIFOXYC12_FULL_39_17]OFZ45592.1 MAG: hypothetical protein A2404_03285 [Bdellovibrionales bacterium RIFOXYC1_FULL_39_130]OFZ77454.1 MAG: hypothetical protein A2560_08875 [Bdellovibrionales bacterium RIFOXYD1_FULL_39_84]OFZ91583.1 MAG: hypothetical protein A2504_06385 [Bdellovibrionales bacterium RIFOXYD12_FULL_39_22]HLE11958.1 He
MSTKTYEALAEFFETHQQNLIQFYPGLTLRRLEQEWSLFSRITSQPLSLFLQKLKQGIPLAYISGSSYFYKAEFFITPDVLIPRYETEILVEMGVKEIFKIAQGPNSIIRIADMGTGSGAIILSLLQDCTLIKNQIEATATDISQAALNVAKTNYDSLRTHLASNHKLTFLHADRLTKLSTPQQLIITNPPYIKAKEDLSTVHPMVKKFEPELALFLKDDEYENWFENMFIQAYNLLQMEGVFLMEGHENHLPLLSKIAAHCGLSQITIHPDLTGRKRFLRACRIKE